MSKSQTGQICVPTSCGKDTEPGEVTEPVEEDDVSVDVSFSGEQNAVGFVICALSL